MAISIFTISIVAIISLMAKDISNTGYAKNKMIASYLGQEGIEFVRNMRDSYVINDPNDWNNFVAKLAPCNINNSCGIDITLS